MAIGKTCQALRPRLPSRPGAKRIGQHAGSGARRHYVPDAPGPYIVPFYCAIVQTSV
jgi:hypothetical protein